MDTQNQISEAQSVLCVQSMVSSRMEKAELWESAKYISWPHSMSSPVVRVPRPCGTPESKSFPMLAGDSEQALFDRCLAYRDQRGIEIWGETRWRQIVFVAKRSVAKRRSSRQTPRTGVHLENRTGKAPAWVAAWYELMQDGTRRKRSKRFSFGTDRAKYPTSNKALAAAIARRKQEEAKWYCVLAEPAGSANPPAGGNNCSVPLVKRHRSR